MPYILSVLIYFYFQTSSVIVSEHISLGDKSSTLKYGLQVNRETVVYFHWVINNYTFHFMPVDFGRQ